MTTTAPIRKLEMTLKKGRTMTVAEIRSRFGLRDPSSAIAKLRKEGMKILTSTTSTGKTAYMTHGMCKAA